MGGLFDRFRRGETEVAHEAAAPDETVVTIDATSLSRVFSAPMWLRDLGLLAWFLVGVGLVLFGLVWLLGLTSTIVDPVLVGAILATVAGPLVRTMQSHRVPRAAGASNRPARAHRTGRLIFLLVFGGIAEQSSEIEAGVSEAVDQVEGWVNDAGVNGTSGAKEDAKAACFGCGRYAGQGAGARNRGPDVAHLLHHVRGLQHVFLLKDGPTVRRFIDRSMGVPAAVATTISSNVIHSLQRYFFGVSIVAAFNAVVVGIGAYLLDIPLWGTIAVVTFVTAYVPFIGAFVSGALAVLLALVVRRNRHCVDHARDRDPGQRAAPEHRAADRVRRDARPQPARRPHRDHRLRSIFGMIGLILGAPLRRPRSTSAATSRPQRPPRRGRIAAVSSEREARPIGRSARVPRGVPP